MTVMTSWDLFEDLRALQDEMLRMNARDVAWRPGQQLRRRRQRCGLGASG